MSYVKPDGKATKSATAYVKAWRALWKPLQEAYGLTVISFDPDLCAVPADRSGPAVDIPLWLAKRMVDVALDAKHGPVEGEGE